MTTQTVIGLEVHVQLATQSKIFCGCSTTSGAEANTHGCPVCTGMPGVLPVLNRQVVEYAIRLALATHSAIQPNSVFARKNYFYPDLPKAYQISQFDRPFSEGGYVEIDGEQGTRRIALVRIHMEEDAGKLVHAGDSGMTGESLVDVNRCGVPLLEIVSEPELSSPEEAYAFLMKVHQLVVYLGISNGSMEEGNLRADVNVNLLLDRDGGRTKTPIAEIKNLNSFRNAMRAIEALVRQQKAMIEDGELTPVPISESAPKTTLLWDADQGSVRFMRSKEQAHDYRYFPEPDLVPIAVDANWIERVRTDLPELPDARRERFVREYGIPDYDAGVLTAERPVAEYYEDVVRAGAEPKAASNWVMGDVLRVLKDQKIEIGAFGITPKQLADLLKLVAQSTISGKVARTVFEQMTLTGAESKDIVAELGLVQVGDADALEAWVTEVIDGNPKEVAGYRDGKKQLLGFFVGQVMRTSGGKANPKVVNQLLVERLNS
ncbi:MAG: Asp-tRNA(Asn)/Glu-tRNA(Gln) amidotransferase subunit GatB [Candidatus Latescibacterota bacterium]